MVPLIQWRAARLMALAFLMTVAPACTSGGASPSPTGSVAPPSPTGSVALPTPSDTPSPVPTDTPSPTPAVTTSPTPVVTAPPAPTPTHTPAPVITPTHAPSYTLVDLGLVNIVTESGWAGVNATSYVAVANFRYHSGTKTIVTPAPGQTSATVLSINATAQMAGAGCSGDYCHATKWTTPASARDLGTLGGHQSWSYQISDSGIVVGFSNTTGDTTTHAFRQTGTAAMVDLNTVVGSGPTMTLREAWGINSSGTIVGWAGANGSPRAFRLTAAGTLTEVGPLPGMTSGQARAINVHAHIAGFSGDGVHVVGWLYNGTTLTAMPTLAGYELMHPYAINASDIVVGCGRKMSDDSQVHALRYYGGTVVDLNTFLPGGSSWVLECATGINDAGTIVGTGRLGTYNHAFMLVPA